MSHFDLLVLNKNHVDIKIDREKLTHHYCRSNPIRDGPLCLKPKYYSGALNILVLNGSHHVAAATWRESKNFFPLFSFSSPSSLHVSCTAAATGMRTMEKREEEHMILFPFYCRPPAAVSKQTLLLFFLLISCDQFTRAALKTFFRGTSQCVSVAQPSFCFKNFFANTRNMAYNEESYNNLGRQLFCNYFALFSRW